MPQAGAKMKFVKILMVLLLPLALLACGNDTKDVSAEKVKQEAGETYDALKAYATKKKLEFQQQAETTLSSYEKQIQALKSKADKASGEARKKYDEALAEWNTKKDDLNKQLEEFKTASAETWADAEQRIEASMDKIKKLYEEAKSALT
jgi:hypothetical protein